MYIHHAHMYTCTQINNNNKEFFLRLKNETLTKVSKECSKVVTAEETFCPSVILETFLNSTVVEILQLSF